MTFTAQQKKNLAPLAKRVSSWNTALDDVSDDCTCVFDISQGHVMNPGVCPAQGHTCMGVTVVAIRINMNLIRLAHDHLSDADLLRAVRALRDLFAGIGTATNHVAFANDLLTSLRLPRAFNQNGGRRS